MTDAWVDEYNLLVSTLAMEYSRKYSIIETADIRQILWMWFVTHPNKYTEWSKLPPKDKEKLIAKSLRNAALKYCEIPTKIKDLNFQFGKTGEVTDGNNWLVLRSDIEKAFNQLTEAKQNILRLRFTTDNSEWSELAKELNTSADGARMRVTRAVNSLIRNLGGWRTYNDTDNLDAKEEDEDDDSRA